MHAVGTILSYICEFLILAIFIQAILSWFIRDPNNKIYMMLNFITQPVVAPFRKFTYRFTMRSGIDFSPMIAIFVLAFLRNLIAWLVRGFL